MKKLSEQQAKQIIKKIAATTREQCLLVRPVKASLPSTRAICTPKKDVGNPKLQQVIKITDHGKSSGHGWSYTKLWLGCQRKAQLITEAQERGEPGIVGHALTLGTIGHLLLQFHETEGYADYALEVPRIMGDAAKEAQEIFARYRAFYPPGHWGKVLDVEMPMIHTTLLGYTGRADVVVHVRTAKHLKAWQNAGVKGILPGYYIVDYKFFTPPFDRVGYLHDPQFTGYYGMRSSLKLPKKVREGIRGVLVLGVNKFEKKRPPAEAIFIPPPNAKKNLVLDYAVSLADERRAEIDPTNILYLANPALCGYGSFRCPFFMKTCELV
jgi:hypothetical protein